MRNAIIGPAQIFYCCAEFLLVPGASWSHRGDQTQSPQALKPTYLAVGAQGKTTVSTTRLKSHTWASLILSAFTSILFQMASSIDSKESFPLTL